MEQESLELEKITTLAELYNYIKSSDIIEHVLYDHRQDKIMLLDQTELPFAEKYLELKTSQEAARAIKEMKVRGGGSLAITGAYGMVLSARQEGDIASMKRAGKEIKDTRPTASSLGWIVNRVIEQAEKADDIADAVEETVVEYVRNKIINARNLARHGAELINEGDTVMTHCHAGAIAGAGYGGITTGIFKVADNQNKNITVFATETRPYLQGARITTWELKKLNIDTVLITDNMAGHYLQSGRIDKVIVGADRVASNGDIANKIGTYMIALAADKHDVPFYAGGHIDLSTASGADIPIEMRDPEEVTHFRGQRTAPEGIRAEYPAFDVTPYEYISGLLTSEGVIRAPFSKNLEKLFS